MMTQTRTTVVVVHGFTSSLELGSQGIVATLAPAPSAFSSSSKSDETTSIRTHWNATTKTTTTSKKRRSNTIARFFLPVVFLNPDLSVRVTTHRRVEMNGMSYGVCTPLERESEGTSSQNCA